MQGFGDWAVVYEDDTTVHELVPSQHGGVGMALDLGALDCHHSLVEESQA
jgi:hypothetical protein